MGGATIGSGVTNPPPLS